MWTELIEWLEHVAMSARIAEKMHLLCQQLQALSQTSVVLVHLIGKIL